MIDQGLEISWKFVLCISLLVFFCKFFIRYIRKQIHWMNELLPMRDEKICGSAACFLRDHDHDVNNYRNRKYAIVGRTTWEGNEWYGRFYGIKSCHRGVTASMYLHRAIAVFMLMTTTTTVSSVIVCCCYCCWQ